jgi:lysophospholipase L1-like esterase
MDNTKKSAMRSPFLLIVFLISCFFAFSQSFAPFKKGDRVAVVGNSITEAGLYESYIWLYYMTRFPEDRLEVYNCGIGGDIAEQIYERFDDDVLSHKPTVITLSFGMNDSRYGEYLQPGADTVEKAAVNTSYHSYLKIEQQLEALKDTKIILLASSPYDETVKYKTGLYPGKSKTLLKIAEFQEAAAKKNNWGFVDFNRPMTAINTRGQLTDSLFTLCGKDRVHPLSQGHMVMAYLFLKAQGLQGKPVAEVNMDISNKSGVETKNCTVTQLHLNGQTVSFDYLAYALPYPLNTESNSWNENHTQADVEKVVPFNEAFNLELLQVKGLSAENKYSLKMGDQSIGVWMGADFAKGINLAVQSKTPEYQQAQEVMRLNESRMELENKLRNYYWLQFNFFRKKNMMYKDTQAAMDTLNHHFQDGWGKAPVYEAARFKPIRELWIKEMYALEDAIYTVNKPRRIRVVIEPVE